MWRNPCSKQYILHGGRRREIPCNNILIDKSYQSSSSKMRFAQQIRDSRGGTTELIPVAKPIIIAPKNKFE